MVDNIHKTEKFSVLDIDASVLDYFGIDPNNTMVINPRYVKDGMIDKMLDKIRQRRGV